MVIAIASTKGGVGKSTLSMHFMHALKVLNPDKKILLMDADPQSTCLNWSRWRAEDRIDPYMDVQPIAEKGLVTVLEQKTKEYDYILIDVGGTDNPNLRRVVLTVDAVIIPTSLEPAERIHTFDMIKLVDEAKNEFNLKLECFMIFNKVKATNERNFIDQFKDGFPDYIHWIDKFIMQRIWFSRVYGTGRTVFDLVDKEEDKKAKEEIMQVFLPILDILGVKHG